MFNRGGEGNQTAGAGGLCRHDANGSNLTQVPPRIFGKGGATSDGEVARLVRRPIETAVAVAARRCRLDMLAHVAFYFSPIWRSTSSTSACDSASSASRSFWPASTIIMPCGPGRSTPTRLLVPSADLLVQAPARLFAARADLLVHGRKFTAHLLAKLRDLRRQGVDSFRQLFENRHSLFEPFYSRVKRLRLHGAPFPTRIVDRGDRVLRIGTASPVPSWSPAETTLPSSSPARNRRTFYFGGGATRTEMNCRVCRPWIVAAIDASTAGADSRGHNDLVSAPRIGRDDPGARGVE